jgi:hypothetical protein
MMSFVSICLDLLKNPSSVFVILSEFEIGRTVHKVKILKICKKIRKNYYKN